MARNTKALTPLQLKQFLDKYRIEMTDDSKYCIVSTVNFPGRKVIHKANETFTVMLPTRKLTISPRVIGMWKNQFKFSHELIEIQNASNYLAQMCQNEFDYKRLLEAINKFKMDIVEIEFNSVKF